jgi:hypothetical protein
MDELDLVKKMRMVTGVRRNLDAGTMNTSMRVMNLNSQIAKLVCEQKRLKSIIDCLEAEDSLRGNVRTGLMKWVKDGKPTDAKIELHTWINATCEGADLRLAMYVKLAKGDQLPVTFELDIDHSQDSLWHIENLKDIESDEGYGDGYHAQITLVMKLM